MTLSKTGKKIMKEMMKEHGLEKGKKVFYASENKGIPSSSKWTIKGELKKKAKGRK